MPGWHRIFATSISWACLINFGCSNSRNTEGTAEATQLETSESTEEQACPDHASVDACCCFSRFSSGVGLDVVCETQALCTRVGIQCSDGLEECSVKSAPEEVRCLLDALAERKTGSLTWEKTSLTASWGVDEITEKATLHVVGDTAIFIRMHFDPERTKVEEVLQVHLKPADYFSQCLSQQSIDAQMNCVGDAFDPAGASVCIDPFDYPRL